MAQARKAIECGDGAQLSQGAVGVDGQHHGHHGVLLAMHQVNCPTRGRLVRRLRKAPGKSGLADPGRRDTKC